MALTELPIDKSTLIYGSVPLAWLFLRFLPPWCSSSNGGVNVVASRPEMNKRMKVAAKMLNIAGHYVSSEATGRTQTKIHGPLDCEGHLGTDNRFYVIDPARCMLFLETSK